jgi:hypothetical protein
MKKFLIIGLGGLAALCWASVGSAQVPTKAFVVTASTQRSQPSTTLIHLHVSDVQSKVGVCPYYIKNLQYIDAVKVLNIELFQDVCANDRYGVSQGDLYWVVPRTLAIHGTHIDLLINGKRNGAISYDDQTQAFKVED